MIINETCLAVGILSWLVLGSTCFLKLLKRIGCKINEEDVLISLLASVAGPAIIPIIFLFNLGIAILNKVSSPNLREKVDFDKYV